MRDYELMYIIAPHYGDDEACSAFAEQINTMITGNGGTIKPLSPTAPQPIGGRRKLAYPLRRESRDVTEGYYVVTHFEADPSQITEIERSLKLSDPILRYLLTLPAEPARKTKEQQL